MYGQKSLKTSSNSRIAGNWRLRHDDKTAHHRKCHEILPTYQTPPNHCAGLLVGDYNHQRLNSRPGRAWSVAKKINVKEMRFAVPGGLLITSGVRAKGSGP
jgi:hypothetical protein